MKVLVGIIGAIFVVIAAHFLPPVQDYYNAKAFAYFQQGELKKARKFYLPGAIWGNEKAKNNYHVLNYRITRYDEEASHEETRDVRRKSIKAFDKLARQGYVPAAYNAGMFYYRHPPNLDLHKAGLEYLDFAAANGDEMSRDAAGLMRARGVEKDKRAIAHRKAADDGNGLAAYLYVKSLRFDKAKLRRAEKYALMGAEAGYADAQQFLTTYFPNRRDRKDWLEKAATNENNRSLIAAYDLAMLEGKQRDYEAKRRWLTLGATPREKFRHHAIVDEDVLRWRGLGNTIMGDGNNSKKSAYELALMQMDGIGGPVDQAGAIKNLTYANDWQDAPFLLERLKFGSSERGQLITSKSIQSSVEAQLKKFDTQKNRGYYEALRPLIKSKHIRFATEGDLEKYKQGVSAVYSNKKSGYRSSRRFPSCGIGSNCFYMEKPTILPKDMFGAGAAKFIIDKSFILPPQHVGHNTYIFVNERYIPSGAL